MERRKSVLKTVFTFGALNLRGQRRREKYLAITEQNGTLSYRLCTIDPDAKTELEGITLSQQEFKKLTVCMKEREEILTTKPLSEIAKFQNDFVQQSHNGSVEKKREEELEL